jgi:hypothetical protein
LDLGGGAAEEAVRQRWGAVKANFGPLTWSLAPSPNSAAAAGLCARFSAARTACRAVKFDGEQIA